MSRTKHEFHGIFEAPGTNEDAPEREFPIMVKFSFIPGTPDVHYLRNGDPGYPGDAPEIEIHSFGIERETLYGGRTWVAPTRDEEKMLDAWGETIRDSLEECAADELSEKEANYY